MEYHYLSILVGFAGVGNVGVDTKMESQSVLVFKIFYIQYFDLINMQIRPIMQIRQIISFFKQLS